MIFVVLWRISQCCFCRTCRSEQSVYPQNQVARIGTVTQGIFGTIRCCVRSFALFFLRCCLREQRRHHLGEMTTGEGTIVPMVEAMTARGAGAMTGVMTGVMTGAMTIGVMTAVFGAGMSSDRKRLEARFELVEVR